jgi:predicted nucleic-acid-binding Zn-ribbon protein
METNIQNVSLLVEVQLQMQVIQPILEKLRTELGKDRAMKVLCESLHDYYKNLYSEQSDSIKGTPVEKWAAMNEGMAKRGGVLDIEVIKKDKNSLKLKVKKCGYAEFYKSIGEPELGYKMGCERDFHVVNAAGGGIELKRTQTIMEGADHCDFNYVFPE